MLTLDLRQTEHVFALLAFFVNMGLSVTPFVAAELEESGEFSLDLKICRIFFLALVYVF